MAPGIIPSPLPALDSLRIEGLKLSQLSQLPHQYSAYNTILLAEENAVEKNDITSARVVGYFLLEFHEQRQNIGDQACTTLVRWITSMPRTEGDNQNDVIYRTGTLLRDKLIRLCALNQFFLNKFTLTPAA